MVVELLCPVVCAQREVMQTRAGSGVPESETLGSD